MSGVVKIIDNQSTDLLSTAIKQDQQTTVLDSIQTQQTDGTQVTQVSNLPTDYLKQSSVLSTNSSSTPLNAGATYTGTITDVSAYNAVVFSCKTDQDGTLYVDFSPNGTDIDSTLSYNVTAGLNEVHRLTITKQFFRIRFINTSAGNQTYLRLQTLVGNFQTLTRTLNYAISDDVDTLVTRPVDFNVMVADGRFINRNFTVKDGINPDIDTGSTPEDVWGGGGLYTGFPSAAAAASAVSTNVGDTDTLYFSYMTSPTDLDYTFGSVVLNGTTPVSLGVNVWRCNYIYYQNTSTGLINAGDISVYHTATPTTIFAIAYASQGQSYCGAYTVPYKSSVFIDRFTATVRGSTSASLDGFVWYRPYGGSPYLRFPFEAQFGALFYDDQDYAIKIPQQVDFVPQITFSSANNITVKTSYRLLKVKQ